MEIYVGNLSFASTEDEIRRLFGVYGTVRRAGIVTDRETGRSRGFCFVDMPNEDEARAAVEALNGIGFQGRTLAVSQAHPRGRQSSRRGR